MHRTKSFLKVLNPAKAISEMKNMTILRIQ